MSQDLMIALIVGVFALGGSTITPIVLGYMTARTRMRDRKMDWARQDEVARRAEGAADAAAAAAKKAAEDAASSAQLTNTKIDVIHTLVNSSMTAAMQAELDATIRELAMMHEVIDLKHSAGKGPLPVAERAIALTEARIVVLENDLEKRKLAQAEVAVQQANGAAANSAEEGPKPL